MGEGMVRSVANVTACCCWNHVPDPTGSHEPSCAGSLATGARLDVRRAGAALMHAQAGQLIETSDCRLSCCKTAEATAECRSPNAGYMHMRAPVDDMRLLADDRCPD